MKDDRLEGDKVAPEIQIERFNNTTWLSHDGKHYPFFGLWALDDGDGSVITVESLHNGKLAELGEDYRKEKEALSHESN